MRDAFQSAALTAAHSRESIAGECQILAQFPAGSS
jgi:hypothetical protein